MTILLYDYRELEERASRHLNVWKTWHLLMYASVVIFGIMNYVFLQNTMALVDNRCVLYPRALEFRMTNVTDWEVDSSTNQPSMTNAQSGGNFTENPQTANPHKDGDTANETKMLPSSDAPGLSGNETHRIVLDTSRTLFGWDSDCQFAEYMPIMSMIFAAAWGAMFIMCPGGGYSRSGLQQPWRILSPALLFALVMVGLTGHSFSSTNNGLQAFCSAFRNVSNATTCSSAGKYLERSGEVSWSFGGRASATRAASAGVWASWACAAALFLARCLAAPDFRVRRTGAYLKDPHQKISPYLKKATRPRGVQSPTRPDHSSIRSEPTLTTELVIASIEHDNETAPPSIDVSPAKIREETIEMTTTPHNIY